MSGKYSISVRIDEILVTKHKRSNHENVKNRILFQLPAAVVSDKHPSATTTFKGEDGKILKKKAIDQFLHEGILFKSQSFVQAFNEPIKLQVHLFQETKRRWFERFMGKYMELTFEALLKATSLGSLGLDKLVGKKEGLKLDDKHYSNKTGYLEYKIDPVKYKGEHTHQLVLTAPETFCSYLFDKNGTSRPPRYQEVIAKGKVTCKLKLTTLIA